MPTPDTDNTAYAVVNGTYLLPFDDALELLRVLRRATIVSSTYRNDAPFRPVENPACIRMEALTIAQHAAVFLEEPV